MQTMIKRRVFNTAADPVLQFVPAILAQIQGFSNEPPLIPPSPDFIKPRVAAVDPSTVRQKGLCRDGWSRGSIIDFSGAEIPVCMRINPQSQTWSEAQETCRQDYGFLLKLDSPAKIDNVNVVSHLSAQGVRRFWTGLHTYAEHLVWDDLIPNSVRPNNSSSGTSFPTRPWRWANNLVPDTSELCGYLNIEDDDKKRRRKRAPDDDSPDGFDLSALQDRLYQFQRPSSEYLPTGAFQSMLSRTQFSDQLPELPGTSLGIQSEQQIPGTGLSDSNLQSGGMFTDIPAFDPSPKPDTDDKENSNSDNGGTTNIMQSGMFAAENQNPSSDLLSSVKDIAAELSGKHTKPQETMLDQPKETGVFNLETDVLGEKSVIGSVTEASVDSPDSGAENLKSTDDKSILGTLGAVLQAPAPTTLIETSTVKPVAGNTELILKENNELMNDMASVTLTENTEPGIKVDDVKETPNDKSVGNDDNTELVNTNENILNTVLNAPVNDVNITQILLPETDTGETVKDLVDNVDSIATNERLLSDVLEGSGPTVDIPTADDNPSIITSDELLKPSDVLPDMPAEILSTENNKIENAETPGDEMPKEDDPPVNFDGIPTDILANGDPETLEVIPASVDNFQTQDILTEQDKLLIELASDIKDNYFDENSLGDTGNVSDIFETTDQNRNDIKFEDTITIPSIDDISEVGVSTADDNDNKKFDIPNTVNNETDRVDDISEKLNDFIKVLGQGTSDDVTEVTANELEPAGIISSKNDDQESLPKLNDVITQLDDEDEIRKNDYTRENSTVETPDDPIESMVDGIDQPPTLKEIMETFTDDMNSDHSLNTTLEDNDKAKDGENDIYEKVADDNYNTEIFDNKQNDVLDKFDDKIDSLVDLANEQPSVTDLEDKMTDLLTGETEITDDLKPEHEIDNLPETATEEPEIPTLELAETVDDINKMSEIVDKNEMSEITDNNEMDEIIDNNEMDEIIDNNEMGEIIDKNEMSEIIDDLVAPIDDVADIDRDNGGDTDFNQQDTDRTLQVLEPEDIIEDGRETPDLAEDIEEEDQKTLITPANLHQKMDLSTCNVRLPSVCFSYEVEVMTTASTCDAGWYGHVLMDSCYKILDGKLSYSQAAGTCKSLGARVALGESKFERNFILLAVHKEGQLFRGEKFWMETTSTDRGCKYFDERGVTLQINCETWLNVVCVKDAKSLSVHVSDNSPYYNDGNLDISSMDAELKLFPSRYHSNNKLICELTSAASEFPVLWFKDGILVETKDKYITPDISLHLNDSLLEAFRRVTSRNITVAALQGKYWCEVWDRKTLTRKRSRPYDVRFSDVITFHGSIQLRGVQSQQGVLFNMMNEKFPSLSDIEMDLETVFSDTLGSLRAAFPDVFDVFTFIDRVRSSPSVVEYHTYYSLQRDYSSRDEGLIYSRVKAILKSKLASPRYMASLPGHTPVSTFRTMSLQSTVSCPAAYLQTGVDVNGKKVPVKQFRFPKAQLGEFANSVDNCSSTNGYPAGTARCLGDFSTGAYWGIVVANECIDEAAIDKFNVEIWGASPFTDQLSEIAQTVVKPDNVEEIVSQVAHITEVAARLTPTDINKIADVLDHSTQVGKLPEKVGTDVLKTIDKLMSTSEKEVHVANVETKAANRIIKSIERYAEHADLGKKGNVRMVSDNVVVELWDLKPNSDQVIGLAAETNVKSMGTAFKDEIIATVFNKSQLDNANVDAAIELPKEVFSQTEKGVNLGSRLTMMVFRKSRLFEAALSSDGKVLKPTEKQLNNLNSYVISASIAGKTLTGLKERVRTIFRPLKEHDSTRSCVWWDFDMNGMRGGWSQAGCYYDGKINGRDICLCDHLTNFAVLLDFYGQSEPIPDHHELSLSIITVLGLACSILGLSLTIISYVFFRKLRQGRAQQTLFNLSLALLFSMLVFLVGIKQTHSYVGCLVVAIMLHYFILVSFMWMLMEAILQYLTFVKILGTYITRFTLKTVLPAWGLPLVPVISVLCVDYHLYHGGPNYCWMDLPAFYFAFAIPITCIIVINIIIFFITIISIFRRGKGLRSNQKKQKMAMTNLQAAITSFILLGLTWVFGYLAIADARLPFQYVFTILNSLQGFFIFILFVVRKKKVRDQWYIICCKGGEKDRVSRSLSASNSIPSSYSNGSNRNSKHERDRSDSTKTTQSTYSNSSGGFTNFGYEHGYEVPYARPGRRFGKL